MESVAPEEVMVLTGVNGLVAGQVALVAEGGLAAVALVWLVAVDLQHVLLQRLVLGKLGVTFVTEERPVFCSRQRGHTGSAGIQRHGRARAEALAHTHHSWSRSIQSASPSCPR